MPMSNLEFLTCRFHGSPEPQVSREIVKTLLGWTSRTWTRRGWRRSEHPDCRGRYREIANGVQEVIMTKHLLGGIVAATVLWPVLGSAQTTVIETTGVAPPDEVVTYVRR